MNIDDAYDDNVYHIIKPRSSSRAKKGNHLNASKNISTQL